MYAFLSCINNLGFFRLSPLPSLESLEGVAVAGATALATTSVLVAVCSFGRRKKKKATKKAKWGVSEKEEVVTEQTRRPVRSASDSPSGRGESEVPALLTVCLLRRITE